MSEAQKFLIEEMNAKDVREKIDQETIAVLVFGACENHGDHMPFGSDFIFPMELAKSVAKKCNNLIILPYVPYGLSLHHDQFQMTISLNPDTLVGVISDLLLSLVKNNINKILIINGHDGNIAPIEIAARSVKNKHPEIVITCLESWWVLIGELRKDLFDVWNGLGHGGEAETSGMLAVRPELVNMELAPKDVVPMLPEHIRIYWKFNELTQTGATGSPQNASIQKGKDTFHALEDVLVSFIDDMRSKNWKYGIKEQ
jgi:creatinine amidohydrolase